MEEEKKTQYTPTHVGGFEKNSILQPEGLEDTERDSAINGAITFASHHGGTEAVADLMARRMAAMSRGEAPPLV